MKLHYTKILLFALPLTILLTSYHVYNKNKEYIRSHHIPRYTSRVLSEGDTQLSIYDKDADMKSVMQQFVDRTSQRFEEYQERLKEKHQKRKDERDKNIQEIIQKDRMEKNLAEKIEKGCLKCGCGLGGVAASVGLFGGLGTYGWKTAALATAKEAAEKFGAAQGAIAGAEEGVKVVIAGITREFGISAIRDKALGLVFDGTNYMEVSVISEKIYSYYRTTCASSTYTWLPSLSGGAGTTEPICKLTDKMLASVPQGQGVTPTEFIKTTVKEVVAGAEQAASDKAAGVAGVKKASFEAAQEKAIEATSTHLYSAIGYSILAILIIVLVMIIIYLVLRYRRKRKMNKKAQYTKLLNQ
ncbi:rifin PIR protein, putative [Plasmodium reichenowi]|uniref:Rifin PIR protein, putative n=1 Tax=Plasmodium reichenowi TaxID=5854 RepID=A0A2P9DKX7_PLARE|nr:rifin PIR protein, putative [Plasmodium reichenowi]